MTGSHRIWDGERDVSVEVPVSGGENVMVPVIRAIVTRDASPDQILIQRRDDVAAVRGLLEIPGGRWGAGESPIEAIVREVDEETGIEVTEVGGVAVALSDEKRTVMTISPLTVVVGLQGEYPAVHVVLHAVGRGDPRPEPGETMDVRWWPIGEVRTEMARNREGFIPSSFAALARYLESVDASAPGDVASGTGATASGDAS